MLSDKSNKCITADNFKKLLLRIRHDVTDPAVSASNTAMEYATVAKEVAENIDNKVDDAVNKANIAVVTANSAADYANTATESATNAEAYATTAKEVAEGIDAKATTAMEDAATAKEIAEGIDSKATTAMEVAAVAKEKVDSITNVYMIKGSITFENLPSEVKPGWVYNISNDFSTTANFIEGAGVTCKAGTNIVAVNIGTDDAPIIKWDILSVGVSIDYATTKDIENIFSEEVSNE